MLVLTIEHESSVYIDDVRVTVLLPDDPEPEKIYLQVHLEDEELISVPVVTL